MGLSRPPLAGHVLFSLLPGNGYDKVLEESAVEETGGSNKSLAMIVVAKVAFSKEREAGGSWWVSDGAGCVPRKEEAEMTQRLLDGSGHNQEGRSASPSRCGCAQRSYLSLTDGSVLSHGTCSLGKSSDFETGPEKGAGWVSVVCHQHRQHHHPHFLLCLGHLYGYHASPTL